MRCIHSWIQRCPIGSFLRLAILTHVFNRCTVSGISSTEDVTLSTVITKPSETVAGSPSGGKDKPEGVRAYERIEPLDNIWADLRHHKFMLKKLRTTRERMKPLNQHKIARLWMRLRSFTERRKSWLKCKRHWFELRVFADTTHSLLAVVQKAGGHGLDGSLIHFDEEVARMRAEAHTLTGLKKLNNETTAEADVAADENMKPVDYSTGDFAPGVSGNTSEFVA